VEENRTLPVALNKCEEYNYMVLFLNRRRPWIQSYIKHYLKYKVNWEL
jgi:hypothetical protein